MESSDVKEPSELERITINFPKILNLRRIKELLAYISKEVSAKISYSVMLRGVLNEGAVFPEEESFAIKRDEYIDNIAGVITTPKDLISVPFIFKRGGRSHRYFDKLKFNIGAYDFNEVNPRQIALMDNVREKVKEYFSKKS